jgi:hypothetical protein
MINSFTPAAPIFSKDEMIQYLTSNVELLDKVAGVLDGVILYGITKMNHYTELFPDDVVPQDVVIDDSKEIGYTFTNLLTMPLFSDQYFPTSNFEGTRWYSFYFDNPVYKGQHLYSIVDRGQYIFPLLTMIFTNTERTFERLQLAENLKTEHDITFD